jgi:integrase
MSNKHANGEGSIRPKPRADGRWEGRYHVEVDGAWKRRSVFGRTKAEVAKSLREALTARDGGAVVASAKETVGSYLDAWLEGAASTIRPRTFASYAQIVRDHLKPGLGRTPLARLQPQHVQRLYQDLLSSGLSPKTVRNVHVTLHRALEQAQRWRLVPTNIADLVDAPRVRRQEMKALSPEEARSVLEAARDDDDLEALWTVALTTGLRQGELLALRWPEVELERGTLRVVASLVRLAGQEPQLAEPKSQRSRRQVELSAGAVDSLRRHRAGAIEAALKVGRPYDRAGFVFRRTDERPLSVTTTWKRWRRLLEAAHVPPMPFHSARHSAATLLLGRGVHPKIVSEMLGHSTVAITLDVYSHVTPAMHREAARVMDELLGP